MTIVSAPDHSRTRASALQVSLLDVVEARRRLAWASCDAARQAMLGQYFTPAPIARFMAGLFPPRPHAHLRLLDAGAGNGMLSAAWIQAVCAWEHPPASVRITAYEIDNTLTPALHDTLELCAQACAQVGVTFEADVRTGDFIRQAVDMLTGGMFAPEPDRYDAVIMNPPYFKIHSQGQERLTLRRAGIEASNIYAGFLALSLRLLNESGDLVVISPRSYCNGHYFRPLRRDLLSATALQRFHLFARRDRAFQDDAVLQETIILHATYAVPQPRTVTISESVGADLEHMKSHVVPFEQVIHPADHEYIIHLPSPGLDHGLDRLAACTTPLGKLGLSVSTGRVVDFRARPWLRTSPEPGTVPLIYPEHCVRGSISWPKAGSKKAQALVDSAQTADLLVPAGVYVLVKRFSAKEERRRVVAVVYDPARQGLPASALAGSAPPAERVGFENHLNYYHARGHPMPRDVARGLATFLNSTPVDNHFRSWSGSTQVNAGDLRKLRYPTCAALRELGQRVGATMPDQEEIDTLIAEVLGL